MKFLRHRFSAAPEGTAALFFIDSLPPGSSPLRSCVHLAPLPAGSIQIFSMLGFAVYSTSLC